MALRVSAVSDEIASFSRIGQRRQVVIPKSVFERLGLAAGDVMEFTLERNRVVMQPKRRVDLEDTLTPSEARKVRQGEAEIRTGRSRPWRQVRDELGR